MFAQRHLFSPSYSSFAALGGVTGELAAGDSSRHKSKVSPPWVCSKCAKKHPSELGCGETVDELIIPDPSDERFYAVRTTEDVDAVLGCGTPHRTMEEQLGCDKCKEGQRKKRRKAAEAAAYYTSYNMHGRYPLVNMSQRHYHRIGQSEQLLSCPLSPAPLDPTLNCMRDARGNAVCSNGLFYPPGCPHTPPDSYFTPGISPDEVVGGILQAKIPPPRAAGSSGPVDFSGGNPSTGTDIAAGAGAFAPAGRGGVSSSPVGSSASGLSTGTAIAAGAGALGIGALLFTLFRK